MADAVDAGVVGEHRDRALGARRGRRREHRRPVDGQRVAGGALVAPPLLVARSTISVRVPVALLGERVEAVARLAGQQPDEPVGAPERLEVEVVAVGRRAGRWRTRSDAVPFARNGPHAPSAAERERRHRPRPEPLPGARVDLVDLERSRPSAPTLLGNSTARPASSHPPGQLRQDPRRPRRAAGEEPVLRGERLGRRHGLGVRLVREVDVLRARRPRAPGCPRPRPPASGRRPAAPWRSRRRG